MIKLILGNVGSGKTASQVREMIKNPHKTYITNIDTKGKGTKHIKKLTADMIIKKEILSYKRDGTPVYEMKLNKEYWQDIIKRHKNINVIIDEAHIFFNPRRSMSKLNIIMTDFLALLRRVLGSTDGTGELILVTQLSRRLDIIAKEMSTDVIYCIHHYNRVCSRCGYVVSETNEVPIKMEKCHACGSHYVEKSDSMIEIFRFSNLENYEYWFYGGSKTYYTRYMINDIETFFKNYDTLQFDDMFSDI